MPANGVEQGYGERGWRAVEMIDLRWFKEAVVSYGRHKPYVKQILNNWATQNYSQRLKGIGDSCTEAGLRLQ